MSQKSNIIQLNFAQINLKIAQLNIRHALCKTLNCKYKPVVLQREQDKLFDLKCLYEFENAGMKCTLRVKLLIETSRAYGQGLLRGIAKYSRLNGHWIFSRKAEFYRKAYRKNNAVFEEGLVDGLIAHVSSKTEAEKLCSIKIPMIIQCVHEKITKHPTIVTDDIAIGQMAAQHLLERGFRNFAFCGLENMYWSDERRDSFRNTLKEKGHDIYVFKPTKQITNTTTRQERTMIADWLDSLPKPLAIMACNDDRGQDIVAACRSVDLRIPEDVIIIGVDNDELICDLSDMPLSSIELASEKGGYEAAELLDQLMVGKKVQHEKIIVRPSQVVTRRSTDFLAIEDFEVVESMRFIKDHASETITVNDVVNAVSLSRRMLEIRFRKVLRQSINDVIQAEHIKLAVQLLNETNMSMSEIAKRSGFSNSTYMGVVFKKVMGMPPLQFRKQIHTQ